MTHLTSFQLEQAASLLYQWSAAGKLPHEAAKLCADAFLDEANTEEAQERFDDQCRRLAGIHRTPITIFTEVDHDNR